MGPRPRPAKVLGKPQGLSGAGETAPPVLGAGAVIVERGFGFASKIRPDGCAKATPWGGASGARKRPRAAFVAQETGLRRSGGRARGLCWLQKSTSGAWSRPKGHGSSPLAHTRKRASAEGEAAPEAGSRWRKPRAREQRYRWRAPRDPTRTARKRGARPGEGALGDGRRPGPTKPASLTRRRGRRAW